jgi:hypothetical protein
MTTAFADIHKALRIGFSGTPTSLNTRGGYAILKKDE